MLLRMSRLNDLGDSIVDGIDELMSAMIQWTERTRWMMTLVVIS